MQIKKGRAVVCIATLTAKADKLEELLTVLAELKQKSPKEQGCLRYELHQDDSNPLVFTFVDRFADEAAFAFHCEQPYTQHYFDTVIPALVDHMSITTHREIELG